MNIELNKKIEKGGIELFIGNEEWNGRLGIESFTFAVEKIGQAIIDKHKDEIVKYVDIQRIVDLANKAAANKLVENLEFKIK